jgi:2-polyprenyl-3-methyl-5-hydroxy-6-metoxy-1,4-benzoquinol methylase
MPRLPHESASATACKLCEGETDYRFSKVLMKKYEAQYHLCRECGSLQILSTEFLAEAYQNQNWALDTGLVARNLLSAAKISLLLSALVDQKEMVIDYGGGTGLLTRLLRDMGWNVFAYDKFGKPLFVDAFHLTSINEVNCRLMIASEVFEHFDRPKEEIDFILKRTKILVFTTELYRDQDENWWYLAPFSGQHVFFWSQKAITNVFNSHGFKFFDFGFFKLGVNNDLFVDNTVQFKIRNWASEAQKMDVFGSSLRPIKNYLADPFKFVRVDYEIEKQKFYGGI